MDFLVSLRDDGVKFLAEKFAPAYSHNLAKTLTDSIDDEFAAVLMQVHETMSTA